MPLLTDTQRARLAQLINDRPEAMQLVRVLLAQTDSPPPALTAAEYLHRGTYATAHVEDLCEDQWPDLVERIDTDPFDNSLEIFFVPSVSAELRCTTEQALQLIPLGFARAWLNFPDGTEQQIFFPPIPAHCDCSDPSVPLVRARRLVLHPRSGGRAAELRQRVPRPRERFLR